jgi:hypothetical protein
MQKELEFRRNHNSHLCAPSRNAGLSNQELRTAAASNELHTGIHETFSYHQRIREFWMPMTDVPPKYPVLHTFLIPVWILQQG